MLRHDINREGDGDGALMIHDGGGDDFVMQVIVGVCGNDGHFCACDTDGYALACDSGVGGDRGGGGGGCDCHTITVAMLH